MVLTDTNRNDPHSHENANCNEEIVSFQDIFAPKCQTLTITNRHRWTSFPLEHVLTSTGNPPQHTRTTHQNQRLRSSPADVLNRESVEICPYLAHMYIYNNYFYVVHHKWLCLNYKLVSLGPASWKLWTRQQFVYNSATSHSTSKKCAWKILITIYFHILMKCKLIIGNIRTCPRMSIKKSRMLWKSSCACGTCPSWANKLKIHWNHSCSAEIWDWNIMPMHTNAKYYPFHLETSNVIIFTVCFIPKFSEMVERIESELSLISPTHRICGALGSEIRHLRV